MTVDDFKQLLNRKDRKKLFMGIPTETHRTIIELKLTAILGLEECIQTEN